MPHSLGMNETPPKTLEPDHEYLTLTEAAKQAPGRPSSNAVWRWARRGVLARTGERVRLRHIRLGGKILTRADWLHDFASTLADADAAHFDERSEAAPAKRTPHRTKQNEHDAARARLSERGLIA